MGKLIEEMGELIWEALVRKFDIFDNVPAARQNREDNGQVRQPQDAPPWRRHESMVGQHLEDEFPEHHWQPQKRSKSTGKRPDFFGTHGRDRIVADAKHTPVVKKEHVDQIVRYKSHPFYAKHGRLMYPKDVHYSDKMAEYVSTKKGVSIGRTRSPYSADRKRRGQ
jgi:hypothetical protein